MAAGSGFVWEDPLLLDDQLTGDEKLIRDTARSFAQQKLQPHVIEAYAQEKTDPGIFREMGELGLLGPTLPVEYGGSESNYVGLWTDRARDRARRFRLSLDDERAVLARHASDLRLRQRRAAQEISSETGERRMDRLLRPDRARCRIGPWRHANPSRKNRRRLSPDRLQDVDHQCADRGCLHRVGQIAGTWRRHQGLHSRKRNERTFGTEDRRQAVASNVRHRRDRHGRRRRAGRRDVAERTGPRGTVRLSQSRPLRHRLGRARSGGILLSRRAPVHARPQAIWQATRRNAARTKEARRYGDRDHARPTGCAPRRPPARRRTNGSGNGLARSSATTAARPSTSLAPPATCTAAMAYPKNSRSCVTC